MIVGVISDTHDNLFKINKAVKFFNKKKVGFVFHLGDFVAPFAVNLFNQLHCPWQGVFGNNDGEREGLLKISAGKISPAPLRVELDNRRITLVHDINTIDITKEFADIILFGHTHRIQVETNSPPLLLNPGEGGGWLTGKSTLALLNLKDLTYRIIRI